LRDTDNEVNAARALRPHVKQLKSTSTDLRRLFDDRVTARYIAEPFIAFDSIRAADDIRAFMEERDFDIVGVRRLGAVVGFADLKDLTSGTLGDHERRFDDRHRVDEALPIATVLTRLAESPRVCVEVWGQISGIITRGDLQKAPVRMWFFALLSLLEMQFLRLIRSRLSDDDWMTQLDSAASTRIRKDFRKRQKRNEEVDLADCTVFRDKVEAIARTEPLRASLGFGSEGALRTEFAEIIALRNDIAHGHDIVRNGAASLARIAARTEELLRLCEGVG
jgi:predicted transcriptional regulator